MAINLYTPIELQRRLADRFKQVRLAQTLTQVGLANRSGVSLGSLKRFENTGKISLESLLQLADTLGYLDQFYNLMDQRNQYGSIADVITSNKMRKRGRQK